MSIVTSTIGILIVSLFGNMTLAQSFLSYTNSSRSYTTKLVSPTQKPQPVPEISENSHTYAITGDCSQSLSSYHAASSSWYQSFSSASSAGAYHDAKTITAVLETFTTTAPSYSFSNLATIGDSTASYAWWTSFLTITTTVVPSTYTVPIYPTFPMTFPACAQFPYEVPPADTSKGKCGYCTIQAVDVQLIYWPLTVDPGKSNFTTTPAITSVQTGLFSGTPYTSGSVYLKYAGVRAINACRNVGLSYPGAVITMASNEVSSLVGDGMLFTAVEPFNYANLNYPVPWNVWAAQQGCISNSAACPFETGLYTPYVSLPSQILNLDPAWSTCTVDPMIGSWDPPYALQPELGSLTAASSLFTNYPVAGATPVSPLASNTAAVFSTLATGANLPTVQPWDPEGLTSPTPISNLPQNPGDTPSGFSSIFPHPEDSAFSDDHTAPVITIQNTAITANSASAYIVGSQTLIAGSTAIIVAGTPISLAPSASAIIIGGTTIPLPLSSTQAVPHISFGNSVYAADSGSTFIIGSQTLKPGGEITISGTTISLAIVASAVVVGETTFPLHDPSPLALPQITIASSIYTRDSFSDLIIGGQTLTPNGQITVSKTPISLAAGGTAVIIGGTTVPFKNVPSPTARPHIIVGSSVYFENSALDFIVDSQTLTAGGQIIVSGTTLYLEAAATAIVIDGSTFPVLPLTTPMPRLLPVLTLGSSIYTENFASNFIIGSQTLTPGGEITLSGTIGSFDASRTEIVIGTSTVGLGEVIISEFGPGVPTTVTVNEPVGIITGASGGAGTTRTTSAGEGESKTAMSENHGGTETPTISSAVTGAAAGGNPALYRAMMWGLFFAVVVW